MVFLLSVAGVVLGSVVIKAAGRRAFRNLTETLNQQQSGMGSACAQPARTARAMA
ncbi:FxsA family protein OS=Streptomyces tendae OX=1932 GN=GUR47_32600 PE=4 SV=1 [Streptomyces tendae]